MTDVQGDQVIALLEELRFLCTVCAFGVAYLSGQAAFCMMLWASRLKSIL